MFFHPVNPVLNETRPIVKAYNLILQKRIATMPTLHWLENVAPRLLTTDGAKLRSEYHLDGTHLHPTYLSLVGEALTSQHRRGNLAN